MSKQSDVSIEKNKSWFDQNEQYSQQVATLDTYRRIHTILGNKIGSTGLLLDIGNGGVFDYDVNQAQRITALDLFLDTIDRSSYPDHIEFVQGSALDMPFKNATFDTVVNVMLLHHLVGVSVKESHANVRRCIEECKRVLKPDGRLIIAESCVPAWFYQFERVSFATAAKVLGRIIDHPVTLQYSPQMIRNDILNVFAVCEVERIPKGRYILQFGVQVPSVLTPAQPYVFVAS